MLLLSSYIPFFLIPLFMAVDMAVRIARLLPDGAGVAVTAERKSR